MEETLAPRVDGCTCEPGPDRAPAPRRDPRAWLAMARALADVGYALTLHGVRGSGSLVDAVSELLRERRVLRWRLAEVQKLMDDGYESGDRVVVRVSKPMMHFVLTGKLPDDYGPREA